MSAGEQPQLNRYSGEPQHEAERLYCEEFRWS